jgi:hypothetical protein
MENSTSIFVPIKVHAFVNYNHAFVNYNGGDVTFRRWEMNYSSLDDFLSPEKRPFDGNAETEVGIYLMWTLPDALRHGKQDENGNINFPIVPNRWLIVRFSGQRISKSYIVESDYYYKEPSEKNLDPANDRSVPFAVGRKITITDSSNWTDQDPNGLDLRAIAPSNILFSMYQPHNQNIFSILEKSKDLVKDNITKDTLSYLVVGWYSKKENDILCKYGGSLNGMTPQEILDELKWEVRKSDNSSINQSIYHGMVFGVKWNSGSKTTKPNVNKTKIKIAVGNSSIDAFTAIIESESGSDPKINPKLFETFQYNLLDILNEPGGYKILNQEIQKALFGSEPGGTRWVIVEKQKSAGEPPTPISKEDRENEVKWLNDINKKQAEIDEGIRKLHSLQRDLYEMWWKYKYSKRKKSDAWLASSDDLSGALDPSKNNNLVKPISDLQDNISEWRDKLEKSISKYAGKIHQSRQLISIASPRFWHANDPVIMISGAHHGMAVDPSANLKCRRENEIVSSVKYTVNKESKRITTGNIRNIIPSVNIKNMPSSITALIDEFFILDPNNAKSICDNHFNTTDPKVVEEVTKSMADRNILKTEKEVLPCISLDPWEQPWLPLFIEWSCEYHHIPFKDKDSNEYNWKFDGDEYSLKSDSTTDESQLKTISGRSILTRHIAINFKSRLKQLLDNNPQIRSNKNLCDYSEKIDGWDFCSQSMFGFNDYIALRNPMGVLAPDNSKQVINSKTMADLIGEQSHFIPQSLQWHTPDNIDENPSPSTFENMCCGQFKFTSILLVDRFGQAIDVLKTQPENIKITIAEKLKPVKYVSDRSENNYVLIRPKLLQSARLNFNFVSSTDDTKSINLDDGVNPICGWILPNHLDRGLSVYGPDGVYIGEMLISVNQNGKKEVIWDASYNQEYGDIKKVAENYPHLGKALLSMQNAVLEIFDSMLKVIDETLWTVAPLGERSDQNLSVLIGRPLALTRAQLQFELKESPLRDPSWPYTFNSNLNKPIFTDYDFEIKLGNQDIRKDGLIGYFDEDKNGDYVGFNSVHIPPEQSYIKQIKEDNFIKLSFKENVSKCITMLIDPRAKVHAQTGILPIKDMDLPVRYINPALAKMEVTFRMGPLLTHFTLKQTSEPKVNENETDTFSKILQLPTPAEKNGKLIWNELGEKGVNEMELTGIDGKAHLPSINPTLREGIIKLTKA